jgi:glycosyltransferase 2 family protein
MAGAGSLSVTSRAQGRFGWLRLTGVVVAFGLFAFTFRNVQLAQVGALLFTVGGPALLWALVPMGVALLAESVGWAGAFRSLGHRVPLLGLYRVRVTSEALALTLPAGMLFCESAKPFLLARHCRLATESSIAGMAARKYLLLVSQAAYLLIFGLLGAPHLEQASLAVVGVGGLSTWVIGAGVLVGLSALVSAQLLHRARVAERALEMLSRLPLRALRRLLESSRARFAQTDGELRRFFSRSHPRTPVCALAFLASWMLEAFETYLILRLLGVELSFWAVGGFEVALSLLRHVTFLLPAGIGLQDLGYLAFLRALGVSDPLVTGAAFVLVKRAKEATWALLGFALLAADLRAAPGRSSPLRIAARGFPPGGLPADVATRA